MTEETEKSSATLELPQSQEMVDSTAFLLDEVIVNASDPHTASGSRMTTATTSAPGSPCCIDWKWRPTHVTFTADGEKYEWNSRAHRKLRYPYAVDNPSAHHPNKFWSRFRVLGWHPKVVSWYICWIGVIANSLWVVNGLYATWPELATSQERADNSIFGTGVVGAFLFIVTGYLGYVEAINHTPSDVVLPPNKRKFRRPCHSRLMGLLRSPTQGDGILQSPEVQSQLLANGYPIVQSASTNVFVTAELFERSLKTLEENGTDPEEALIGRNFDIRIGKHVLHMKIGGMAAAKDETTKQEEEQTSGSQSAQSSSLKDQSSSVKDPYQDKNGYTWWTWRPDLHHLGIFNALVMFISSIIFFIPAVDWYPMANKGAPLGSTIFWVYVLQIVASIGFVYVGHASIAEAAGSWWKPDLSSIGWWIAAFNTLGGYGFLLYAILALPTVVTPGCCETLTKWGSDLATFWGSCCFWIAGILLCVEFGSQHPLLIGK